MAELWVHRIDDPSAEYTTSELRGRRLRVSVDNDTTIRSAKQRVTDEWGGPARYYDVSYYQRSRRQRCGILRFSGEILHGSDDGRRTVLATVTRPQIIKNGLAIYFIGAVLIPAAADDVDDEAEDDEVEMVRRVDTVAERIEAGRATAIEIADDADDEEDGPPRPKRARRAVAAEGSIGRGGGGEARRGAVQTRNPSAAHTTGWGRSSSSSARWAAAAELDRANATAEPARDDGAGNALASRTVSSDAATTGWGRSSSSSSSISSSAELVRANESAVASQDVGADIGMAARTIFASSVPGWGRSSSRRSSRWDAWAELARAGRGAAVASADGADNGVAARTGRGAAATIGWGRTSSSSRNPHAAHLTRRRAIAATAEWGRSSSSSRARLVTAADLARATRVAEAGWGGGANSVAVGDNDDAHRTFGGNEEEGSAEDNVRVREEGVQREVADEDGAVGDGAEPGEGEDGDSGGHVGRSDFGQPEVEVAVDEGALGDAAGAEVDVAAAEANGAAGTTAQAEEARAEAGAATPPSLRQWLSSLGANCSNADRFDRYAPAFEDEFGCLEDLALAANEPGGMEGILRDCGVDKRGDKARIRFAIGKLPKPQ